MRVKVSIPDELDYLKTTVLGISGGSPGQQMIVTQMLSRRIADHKLQMANEEGMFTQRGDVLVGPFTGPFAHLFGDIERLDERGPYSLETRSELPASACNRPSAVEDRPYRPKKEVNKFYRSAVPRICG